MREVDSEAYGRRVRARREELELSQAALGKESGYSQQNILTIEAGRMKRPQRSAADLAGPLQTTREWLLWKEGPKQVGPRYLTGRALVEKYEALSPESKRAISQAIENEAAARRRSG